MKKFLTVSVYVFLILLAVAVVFCVTALVYGACTDMTFIETMEKWFNIAPAEKVKDVTDAAIRLIV